MVRNERKGPGWGNNPYLQPVTELRRTRLRQPPYVPYLYMIIDDSLDLGVREFGKLGRQCQGQRAFEQ